MWEVELKREEYVLRLHDLLAVDEESDETDEGLK
jgi:hypothetical protein